MIIPISAQPELFDQLVVTGNSIFHGMIIVDTICTTDRICYDVKDLAKHQVPASGRSDAIRCPVGFPTAETIAVNTFVCTNKVQSTNIGIEQIPLIIEESTIPDRQPREVVALQKAPFEFLTLQQDTQYREYYQEFLLGAIDRNTACEGQNLEGHVSSNCSNKMKRLGFLDFRLTQFEDMHFP